MWTCAFLLVLVVAVFYLGAIVGIIECKRRFQIPPGAVETHHIGDGVFVFLKEDEVERT